MILSEEGKKRGKGGVRRGREDKYNAVDGGNPASSQWSDAFSGFPRRCRPEGFPAAMPSRGFPQGVGAIEDFPSEELPAKVSQRQEASESFLTEGVAAKVS
jgi:hypothetical protein